MTQTRFIFGFALASLAFLAGGYAVGLLYEFGGFRPSDLWLWLTTAVAFLCAWLVLAAATGHRPDIMSYFIGAGTWFGLIYIGPAYLHENYAAVDLAKTVNLIACVVFFAALAAWFVAVFCYWVFRTTLYRINIAMPLIMMGAIAVVGYDVYGIYNPAKPGHQLDLEAAPLVTQTEITLDEISNRTDELRTPCSPNMYYAPLLHLTDTDELSAFTLQAEFEGAHFGMKGRVEFALRDGTGNWMCQISFGEALTLVAQNEAVSLPVSLFVGNGVRDQGLMRLTICSGAEGCDVNTGVSR